MCRKAFLPQLVDTQVAVAPCPESGRTLSMAACPPGAHKGLALNVTCPTSVSQPRGSRRAQVSGPPGRRLACSHTASGGHPLNRQLQLPCLAAASLQASCLDETAERKRAKRPKLRLPPPFARLSGASRSPPMPPLGRGAGLLLPPALWPGEAHAFLGRRSHRRLP